MFKPNVEMMIEKPAAYDEYGQPTLAGQKIKSRCSVVKLATQRMRTTVRTDTSGSGGNAHEVTADARLMVKIGAVAKGDKVTVRGETLRVEEVQRRIDVNGKDHHDQVDCSKWV